MSLIHKEISWRWSFEKMLGIFVRLSPSIDSTFRFNSIDRSGRYSTFVEPIYNFLAFFIVWITDKSAIGFFLTIRDYSSVLFFISSRLSTSFSSILEQYYKLRDFEDVWDPQVLINFLVYLNFQRYTLIQTISWREANFILDYHQKWKFLDLANFILLQEKLTDFNLDK